ncbi:out at first protein homolog [Trichomycterus rosablanca]|uniref:out at first protein homolog n=1 Tax=Trichomycterus rosablanca TaxID=2290929 RepID=UPI002F35EE89
MNGCSVSAGSLRYISVINVVLLGVLVCLSAGSELKVRVKLLDGQIAEQRLESDSDRDIISVEFRHTDGTLITFLSDFKRHVKILRALVLGEPERGQTQYQALCFISRLEHGEIIPSEAMVRLRQKNPDVVRTAEEKRGTERMRMNMAVNLTLSGHLSSHIRSVCRDARDVVYAREEDVKYWIEKGVNASIFKDLPPSGDAAAPRSCSATADTWQPCSCSYTVRLEWYPCALKFCRGRGPSPYRCGIRSCSKAYSFDFYMPRRQLCMWDEES